VAEETAGVRPGGFIESPNRGVASGNAENVAARSGQRPAKCSDSWREIIISTSPYAPPRRVRPLDRGKLENARIVEQITALLIGLNIRHKGHAGIRITGLPPTACR
jgi:hypothetical protein